MDCIIKLINVRANATFYVTGAAVLYYSTGAMAIHDNTGISSDEKDAILFYSYEDAKSFVIAYLANSIIFSHEIIDYTTKEVIS